MGGKGGGQTVYGLSKHLEGWREPLVLNVLYWAWQQTEEKKFDNEYSGGYGESGWLGLGNHSSSSKKFGDFQQSTNLDTGC
jgi:hypothetical protein